VRSDHELQLVGGEARIDVLRTVHVDAGQDSTRGVRQRLRGTITALLQVAVLKP
jgi:hypothetical protein